VGTYVALLRAVNVGGRKLAMPDLRRIVSELGAEDVVTYVQSGNVAFSSGERAGALAPALEEAIRAATGLDVRVLLRTRKELERALTANPLLDGRDQSKLHVTFLEHKPAAARVRALGTDAFEPDEFRVVGREVYLHCPNGYGRSKLTNAFFERRLDVAATTRNWKTVGKLLELTSGSS
jgi:uncharacterized protein (DUF1697 family)